MDSLKEPFVASKSVSDQNGDHKTLADSSEIILEYSVTENALREEHVCLRVAASNSPKRCSRNVNKVIYDPHGYRSTRRPIR